MGLLQIRIQGQIELLGENHHNFLFTTSCFVWINASLRANDCSEFHKKPELRKVTVWGWIATQIWSIGVRIKSEGMSFVILSAAWAVLMKVLGGMNGDFLKFTWTPSFYHWGKWWNSWTGNRCSYLRFIKYEASYQTWPVNQAA